MIDGWSWPSLFITSVERIIARWREYLVRGQMER